MPRRPRIILPNVAVHLMQRGNNRQPCFFHNQDYQFYLDWLHEYAIEARCDLHAYVLMTNHVHLLLTPRDLSSPGTLMKRLGQRYVQYINRTYQRSGTLWEGRYKSCIAQHEHYALSCYQYIELNPVRAKMVSHPADYRWSSYRANAQNESNRMLKPHESYLALGIVEQNRKASYRELFRSHLEPGLIDEIRSATNGNFVLGNIAFQNQIAAELGRRVTRGKAGRPAK